MLHVRGRMPYAMDIARAEAKQYVDWKYYIRRFPLTTTAVVAVVAYWAIPSRSGGSPRRDRAVGGSDAETSEVASKASWIGVVTSLATSLAVRGATNYFSGQLQNYLAGAAAPRKGPKHRAPNRDRSLT